MKNLINYIKESYSTITLYDVKVVFDVLPKEFYLSAPESYSESDIQIYLGDILLSKLPSENDKYSHLLGKNKDNISDAYFEYEKFEHINDYDKDVNLEWDSYYDERLKDDKLNTFKLTNLKYIILFNEFDIKDDNKDDIKETMNTIFKAFDSSNINKYPVEIQYNSDLLEYTE